MSRSRAATLASLAALLALACQGAAGGGGEERAGRGPGRPNVVLIVADDLGINDLSLNDLAAVTSARRAPVETPHIDSIAGDGVRFTAAYAPHATCAPSRAGLLTGRAPSRYGFEFNPGGGEISRVLAAREYLGIPGRFFPERVPLLVPPREFGVPRDEILLPELLREVGYASAMFGKWHVGFDPMDPAGQGFDHWVGFYGGASRYARPGAPDVVDAPLPIDEDWLWEVMPYSVVENGTPRREETAYQTDLWADEAVAFLRERAGEEPFFVYLAFNAPHTPLQAPRRIYDELEHIEDHDERVYYAMVVSLDRAVGRVLAALDEAGVADDTLVVFTSDNGGASYTRIWSHNLPLRGYKGSFWEGGVRVPLFVRGPGVGPAGRRIDEPVGLLDLYPTIARLAGAALPEDRAYDGIDLVARLDGSATGRATGRDARRFLWRAGEVHGIRDGNWKLFTAPRPEPGVEWLYDLSTDPFEHRDLSEERPDVVRRLEAIFDEFYAPLGPPRNVVPMELPVFADPPVPGREGEDRDPDATDFVYYPG